MNDVITSFDNGDDYDADLVDDFSNSGDDWM
jgi:hypothetical protein